jgi:phosphoribosyl 1,2-cyclic phosphodiesterase
LPFDVVHDAPESLGYVVSSNKDSDKLLFCTDTFYLKYRVSGLSIIAIECNYSIQDVTAHERLPRLITSHMSLEHLIDMLKANDLSNVKQIYLLHLSEDNSDAERFKLEVQKATGAEVYVA